MRKITADLIYTMASPPLKNGVVIVDDAGKILDVIPNSDGIIHHDSDVEYHQGILTPGFINCHCHLELSFFKGLLAEHTGLDVFIRDILALKRPDLDTIHQSIMDAETEMKNNGIVAVGDISNGDTTYAQKAKGNLLYHTFIEVFAFDPNKSREVFDNAVKLYHQYPKGLNRSITPHAPYSVSDELFKLIADFNDLNPSILSIHNQECDGENELFKTKSGTIYERIKSWGTNLSNFHPTGINSLPSVLNKMNRDAKLLLVHNTVSTKEDITWALANHPQLYWCFCPNANLYIENKLADYQSFIKANARCVVGTDSYASNWSLSILDELKTISHHDPSINLDTLLQWATRNGAEFLGYEESLGTLERGKKPGINLVNGMDSRNLRLTKETKVTKLV